MVLGLNWQYYLKPCQMRKKSTTCNQFITDLRFSFLPFGDWFEFRGWQSTIIRWVEYYLLSFVFFFFQLWRHFGNLEDSGPNSPWFPGNKSGFKRFLASGNQCLDILQRLKALLSWEIVRPKHYFDRVHRFWIPMQRWDMCTARRSVWRKGWLRRWKWRGWM